MHTLQEARVLNEMARSIFVKDGHHSPLALTFSRGRITASLNVKNLLQDAETKDELRVLLRQIAGSGDVSAIALIMETWFAKLNEGSPEAKKFLKGGVQVKDVPSRTEALMVMVQSDDGLDVCFISPVTRDGDGKPVMGEVEEMRGMDKGRFAGLFRDEESHAAQDGEECRG